MDTERGLGGLALGGLWLVTAAVAVGVGFGAVRLVGAEVTDPVPAPLSTRDIGAQARSVAPSASPSPAPSRSAPSAAVSSRTIRVTGGTVTVRCDGDRVGLLYATPTNGYRQEIGHRGPEEVEVEFEGAGGRGRVKARCAGGRVQAETR
ncbi:MAG TPA: hypothetical protein VGP02_17620 [Mycobacteriales bacterium]|nr:hypothetical protein [Mycobacteriales bacterium]